MVPATHGIAGQGGGDDTTLEIAPQPGLAAPKAAVRELPTDRNFNPGEDNASVDPNFRPGTENGTGDIDSNLNGNGNSESGRPHARPYLGITVQYTTMCYLGGEEHGLEVLTIDPNSPGVAGGSAGAFRVDRGRRGAYDFERNSEGDLPSPSDSR